MSSSSGVNVTSFAIIGGACSALGSLLGKASGQFDSWILKGVGFLIMVCVNSVGFMLFTRSLNASSTSITPTLLCTASNYIASAVFGLLVFGEQTSQLWWMGTSLILAGILLITRAEKTKKD